MWVLILSAMFGFEKRIFRWKLVLWLFKSMGAAFAGCERDPLPTTIRKRFFWYMRRAIALVRLYTIMMDHYSERNRKGKR